ncbi:MAG: ubiquinone/menaquinone biosynthesis methyltransferase [Candidatus Aminicenantes bacterium]|nr:ubiquinone/menaquinone biosynthesis methyltransferase [Candidatus Aminicenantes bacterium]
MKKGVQKIYSEVALTYDRLNHILTLGLDIIWRKHCARFLRRAPSGRWLDVCSGTGEMLVYLDRIKPRQTTLFAADFSLSMLDISRRRNHAAGIHFCLSDVRRLPFPDNTFSVVLITFATRNIDSNRDRLLGYLREFRRVLAPGGLFVNLETSQPPVRLMRRLFHSFIRLTVHRIGARISGSKAGYAYLAHTIPRFYDAPTLSDILVEAGFQKVAFKRHMFGIAARHTAVK